MATKQIHPCECKEYNGGQCYNCLNGAHDLCRSCKKKRSKRVGLTLVFGASDMGKKGARNRWKGSTKADRKEEMRRIAFLRWAEVGEKCSDSKRRAKSNVRMSDAANVDKTL